MNRILALGLIAALLIAISVRTTYAQQPTVAPAQPHARGAGQQPPRGATKAALSPDKQAQLEARKAAIADLPKRTDQQIRTARAIERAYLVGFQNQVGLSGEQSLRLSSILSGYVQRQLMLADRQTNVMKRLTELNEQHASDEELRPQMDLLYQTRTQLANTEKKFFNDMNPNLTVPQQARLQIFMKETEKKIRSAIQESKQ